MYCHKCGLELPDDANFCMKCGSPQKAGLVPDGSLANCGTCHGKGELRQKCPQCEGTGREVCHLCSGSGREFGYPGDHSRCSACQGTGLHQCDGCAGRGYYWSNCTSCDGTGHAPSAAAACIAQDGGSIWLYWLRGLAYKAKGEWEYVLADCERALALDPKGSGTNHYDIYPLRADAFSAKGELDLAIADYDRITSKYPDRYYAYNARGLLYARKGDYDSAIADYGRTLDRKSDHAEAWRNRGDAYAAKSELDQAIAHFDQAIAFKADFADAYESRAMAWLAKKQYDKAWEDVRHCREAGGAPSPSLLHALEKASGGSGCTDCNATGQLPKAQVVEIVDAERMLLHTARQLLLAQVVEIVDAQRKPQEAHAAAPASPRGTLSAGKEAGETTIGPDGGTYVWVPAGAFWMGASDAQVQYAIKRNEGGNPACEQPRHFVEITSGFWLAKHQVTNEQYRRFCAQSGRPMPSGDVQGDWYPVYNVTWDDAKAYCDHYGLRLPSEAEWEYAARGEKGALYPWGQAWDETRCYRSKTIGEAVGSKGARHPVGSFPAGASWCGALDMAGSVQEYCADWWDPGYYSRSPARDPKGPDHGDEHVLRGGLTFIPNRGAHRDFDMVGEAGFRCASIGFHNPKFPRSMREAMFGIFERAKEA